MLKQNESNRFQIISLELFESPNLMSRHVHVLQLLFFSFFFFFKESLCCSLTCCFHLCRKLRVASSADTSGSAALTFVHPAAGVPLNPSIHPSWIRPRPLAVNDGCSLCFSPQALQTWKFFAELSPLPVFPPHLVAAEPMSCPGHGST